MGKQKVNGFSTSYIDFLKKDLGLSVSQVQMLQNSLELQVIIYIKIVLCKMNVFKVLESTIPGYKGKTWI